MIIKKKQWITEYRNRIEYRKGDYTNTFIFNSQDGEREQTTDYHMQVVETIKVLTKRIDTHIDKTLSM